MNWYVAAASCQRHGGARLATFDDDIHTYFASSLLTQGPVWIGLAKSCCTWPDLQDDSGEVLLYHNFNTSVDPPAFPDLTSSCATATATSLYWQASRCEEQHRVVCQSVKDLSLMTTAFETNTTEATPVNAGLGVGVVVAVSLVAVFVVVAVVVVVILVVWRLRRRHRDKKEQHRQDAQQQQQQQEEPASAAARALYASIKAPGTADDDVEHVLRADGHQTSPPSGNVMYTEVQRTTDDTRRGPPANTGSNAAPPDRLYANA